MSPRQIVHGLPWLLLTALPLPALAASNAGSLLKQIESQSAPPQSAPSLKTPSVPTPPAAGDAGPLVRINEFLIEGNQLLPSNVLQRALAGFSGRDLSLTQLQEAAWVIVWTYREAGWLAHAFVPPQEIDRGIVNLKVIEAKLGQLRIDFPKDAHLPHRRIQSMADAQLLPGQPLSLHQVDRLVLLLSDMSGVVASASDQFNNGEAGRASFVLPPPAAAAAAAVRPPPIHFPVSYPSTFLHPCRRARCNKEDHERV